MNNILITGGAGFIASNLIKYIIKCNKNTKIFSYDDYSTGTKKNHINSKNITYIKGKTQNISKNRMIKKINFDYIFHFAEFSRIVPSFKNYHYCIKTNSEGTFEVIQLAYKKKS